jgi:ribosomal protein S18 acetylase RimI-like enzyme
VAAAIRPYDPARDAAALRACFVELQDFERALDPGMPSGDAVADAYLARMLARCASWDGCVFVAEDGAAIVGFATVWSRVPPEEPDEPPEPYAYVSDLVVLPASRSRGVGAALLARAEAFARERGAPWLGIGVLVENRARRLYERLGFAPFHLEMKKPLA